MEEVQRISALAHLAVRERRLREAQEAGTRQAEEMLRERENAAFRNAMGLHNQTVDSYLQAIIEKAGAGNAQEEVKRPWPLVATHAIMFGTHRAARMSKSRRLHRATDVRVCGLSPTPTGSIVIPVHGACF